MKIDEKAAMAMLDAAADKYGYANIKGVGSRYLVPTNKQVAPNRYAAAIKYVIDGKDICVERDDDGH